jgi:broad specificity phosphatase PhoE
VSTIVHLVRHGQTTLNAEGRFRGRLDPPLDDRGSIQAAEAARALAGRAVAAVYAGPLLRTIQTARFIAHPARVRVRPCSALVDLDHGRWTGLTPEEARALDPEAFERFRRSPRTAEAPEGERMQDLERRIVDALRALAVEHDGSSVVGVTHEIPIRSVIAAVTDVDGSAFWEVPVPTGSITTLRIDDGRLSVALADRSEV